MAECVNQSPPRRSKRRSSFAASRINILHKGTVGEELYNEIDTSKTKEERLIILTKMCVEHTLKKMETEILDGGDYNTVKREVEEAVFRKIADMEVNGMFKEATEKDRTLPNPINAEMDIAIEDLNSKISRLQEESNNWDKLIKETEENITDCERKSKDCKLTEVDIPDTLKAESGQYLCNRLDYNSLLTDLDQTSQRTCMMIHEHARIVKKLNTAFELVSSCINSHMLEWKEALMPVGTPRRELQSLLTFPTPR